MTENNVKQADVITGAAVLRNNNGSAPGQWLEGQYEGKQKIVILLPRASGGVEADVCGTVHGSVTGEGSAAIHCNSSTEGRADGRNQNAMRASRQSTKSTTPCKQQSSPLREMSNCT